MSERYLAKIKFLIVDDNSFSRVMINRILKQFDAQHVYEASDGEDAKTAVKSFRPDIIITDWMMKPVNGMEFVRWIREDNDCPAPFTPVIMVSAFSHLHNILQARDAGINEFLAKPISAASLLARVQAVIDRPRQYVRADAYFGPDRRRRGLPHKGSDRRDEENPAVDMPTP